MFYDSDAMPQQCIDHELGLHKYLTDLCLDPCFSVHSVSHGKGTAVVQMCILAGCDFAKGLPGIGMKKAHQHIRKYRTFVRVRPYKLTSSHCTSLLHEAQQQAFQPE